jgi:hypothetical protein
LKERLHGKHESQLRGSVDNGVRQPLKKTPVAMKENTAMIAHQDKDSFLK